MEISVDMVMVILVRSIYTITIKPQYTLLQPHKKKLTDVWAKFLKEKASSRAESKK